MSRICPDSITQVNWKLSEGDQVNIDGGGACNPFTATLNSRYSDPNFLDSHGYSESPKLLNSKIGGEDFKWAPQVTAPYPFQGIAALFAANHFGKSTETILSSPRKNVNMIYVTPDFFQSSPGGISSGMAGYDLLGFFSVILSYAKAAHSLPVDFSPKLLFPIMPRTEFTTMYSQIKSQIPESASLYEILKILACYRYKDQNQLELAVPPLLFVTITVANQLVCRLDTDYCTGTLESFTPNSRMDE